MAIGGAPQQNVAIFYADVAAAKKALVSAQESGGSSDSADDLRSSSSSLPKPPGLPTLEKLEKLKEMLDRGLISESEFNAKKAEIMATM